MDKANLAQLRSFTTLDGSQIRELAGPAWTAQLVGSGYEAMTILGNETVLSTPAFPVIEQNSP